MICYLWTKKVKNSRHQTAQQCIELARTELPVEDKGLNLVISHCSVFLLSTGNKCTIIFPLLTSNIIAFWLCRCRTRTPYWRACEERFKEARNSFSFFQSNKHILSLDTVRVIIIRRNLARVLSTHRSFSHYIFLQNNVTMATILGISLSLKINLCCLFSRNGMVKFSHLVLPDNVRNTL